MDFEPSLSIYSINYRIFNLTSGLDGVLPPFDVALMPDNAEYRIAYDLTYHSIVDPPPLGYGISTGTP